MTDNNTEQTLPEVERVAAAIYDADDSQSGDTIGTVIWNSSHLFYECVDGEEIVDTARRACMTVCRDAARAAIAALRTPEPLKSDAVAMCQKDGTRRVVHELRLSEQVFRDYARQHKDKAVYAADRNDPREAAERERKARRNEERADACKAALDMYDSAPDPEAAAFITSLQAENIALKEALRATRASPQATLRCLGHSASVTARGARV